MDSNIKLSLITVEDIEFLYQLLKERLDYSDDLDKLSESDFPSFSQHEQIISNYLNEEKSSIYKS